MEEDSFIRFRQTHVGFVENLRMSYNIQKVFDTEGYFSIKVTPLGVNVCLMEERELTELDILVAEARNWLSQWFMEIRKWSPEVVDSERVTWLGCYGISCQAWNLRFFKFMLAQFGVYLCADEETINQSKFNVARILICVSFN